MSKYDKLYNPNIDEKSPLIDGETLIFSARPRKAAFIINQVITMMPVALIWLAFDSFFIINMFQSDHIGNVLYFLIPFFVLHLMPVWLWLGNVLSANRKWKNTKYYVTDKRIIIENGFVAENYQTIYYKDIKNIFMRRGLIDQILKVGDIYFDLGFTTNNKNIRSAFLDIENATEIYAKVQKVVMDIQTDIEYPNALRPDENPGYKTEYKA